MTPLDLLLTVIRFLLPAWVISALAFMAAGALWLVRPMPKYIRLSIIVPLVYFGVLYLAIHVIPETISGMRIELARLGMALILLPIIINSVIVFIEYKRSGRRL